MSDCDYSELYSKNFPFWDKLTEEQRSSLCLNTRSARYSKGENVHGRSGGCTGAVFVVSGQLRAYLLSEEGREITLYRLYPGDICMLSASCVLKSITFDVFVDAEEDSEVRILNPSAFSKVCDENVWAENFALSTVVERFSDVMWAMQQVLFMSFDKRLAVFLLDELARTGGDTVALTHEQIAKYTGSAREVVSRMLKYFSAEGITDTRRGVIHIIDRAKLRRIAGV